VQKYWIEGKCDEVLTAKATRSVIVVIVTVGPVRDITRATVSGTLKSRGCRSRSSRMMNMSSMATPTTRNGKTPTILTNGVCESNERPYPASIPRPTQTTPPVPSKEWPVSGFLNFPSMMLAKVIIRVKVREKNLEKEKKKFSAKSANERFSISSGGGGGGGSGGDSGGSEGGSGGDRSSGSEDGGGGDGGSGGRGSGGGGNGRGRRVVVVKVV